MTCGLTKYEIYLIWKIAYKGRWCPRKHISQRDLIKGRPCDELNQYKNALEKLIKDGMLQEYKSQGRNDVCMPKKHLSKVLQVLKEHKDEYKFIIGIEFIS